MYIIVFEDDSIRLIENIDEGCLAGVKDGVIDIIDPVELKLLSGVLYGNLVWEDIKQI